MKRASLIFGMLLVFGACGAESGDTTTPLAEGSTTTTAEAETTTTSAPTTTTTEATTTTTAAQTGGRGESCLVGQWELDSEAFMANLADAFAAEESLENVTVEFVDGSYIVTMNEDGSFVATRDGWAFQAITPDGTFRLTIEGMDEGTWQADGSTLMVTTTESSTSVSAQAVVDGEVIDLPLQAAPTVQSDAFAESSSYECEGDELVVTVEEGFVSEMSRVSG